MIKRKQHLVFISLVFLSLTITAQEGFLFQPEQVKLRLKETITVLASEEMEGREAGTEGEKKAAAYIQDQMEQAGLTPLFEDSYLQEFEFYGDWSFGEENFVVINQEEFVLNTDFFVLPNSASERVYAQAAYVGFGLENELYNDYESLTHLDDKIFFMEYYLPDEPENTRGRQSPEILQKKIKTAQEKGALAVVFVNTLSERSDPSTSLRQRLGEENIPVLFAKTHVLEYWQQTEQDEYLLLSTDLNREVYTAYNVAGYIDNQAEHTVVIGGHYDHLGYGRQGSRDPGTNLIHPGADDNASGIAGMLEAARFLGQSDLTSNNYIFIAFSAEEKGLLGSRHFANSDAYEMETITYMLNFDMLGRVEERSITIYGTGSSPVWESTLDMYMDEELIIRKSASGVGASDHTNFYRKNIPVLFFFSGLHDDYHRPSDTEDKINYLGMLSILDFAYDLIGGLDDDGKLPFSETPVTRRGTIRKQVPLLGLMPDHAFEGEGLKIETIAEDKPAHKAGLVSGDVIVQIGEVKVIDIQTYMQALGALTDSVAVIVGIIRGGEALDVQVGLREEEPVEEAN